MHHAVPPKRASTGLDPHSLAGRLNGEALPIHDALRYAAGIAEALKHWQRRNGVYGALMPATVVLDDYQVSLVTPHSTETPPYRAPELWMGGARDARSDIFALGVICYEMFTGQPPFRANDEPGFQRAILEQEPDRITALPPRLTRLLALCFEKRPERRLQRVGLLLTELRLHEIQLRRQDHSVPAAARPTDVPAFERTANPSDQRPAVQGHPRPARSILCPRCQSGELQRSQPRNRFERVLAQCGVRILRCPRCFSRYIRAGMFRIEIDGDL